METRVFSVGLFFESVETIIAESLDAARKEAERRAEGIADSAELTITHVEVVELYSEPRDDSGYPGIQGLEAMRERRLADWADDSIATVREARNDGLR